MKDLKTIRGMPDLYAEEMNRISFVEDVCTKIFRSFNFQEFRTPILENKSLFERSAGDTSDIVQKEVYEFEDRKGDLLCTISPLFYPQIHRLLFEQYLMYRQPIFRIMTYFLKLVF